MADILLFGGTTEGRELAELLCKKNIPAMVCVATEYGESLLDAGGCVSVRTGRLDEAEIEALIRESNTQLVVDATHPYAAAVGKNICAACNNTRARYIRVLRESSAASGFIEFADMNPLIRWLNNTQTIVFSALGAKEATQLAQVSGFQERIWLRILPSAAGLTACLEAGFPPHHIICMQGPFSQQLNTAMFQSTDATVLLTKESGAAGGFPEKLAAAHECGMTVAVLGRPCRDSGMTLGELKRQIEDNTL